jgi:hypothetical protein
MLWQGKEVALRFPCLNSNRRWRSWIAMACDGQSQFSLFSSQASRIAMACDDVSVGVYSQL